MILMFVISSLFPTLNNMGAGLTSWMIILRHTYSYTCWGYWLCWKAPQGIVGNRSALTVVTLLCLAIIVAKCYYGFNYYGYADPVTICLAATLFLFISVIQHELEICKLDSPLLFRHIFGTQRIYQLRLQVPENRDGVGCAHLEFHRLLPAVHAVVISQHVYSDENPVHEEVYIVASIFCLLRDIDRQNS